MTDADRERFARVLLMIAETYKDSFSAPRAELYFQSLKRFEIDDIERALPIMVADPVRKFSPKPSDFVETIEGTPTDRALRSVTRVEVAAAAVGPYHSVTFGSDLEGRLIHALIEHLGGWVAVCNKFSDEKGRGFFIAEFTKLHRMFEKTRPNVVMDHMPGIFEVTNRLTRGSWDHGIDHQEVLHVIDAHGHEATTRALVLSEAAEPKKLAPHDPEPPTGSGGIAQATKEMLERWKAQYLSDTKLTETVKRDTEPPLDSGETFFKGKT
jgi:hypothetical protein